MSEAVVLEGTWEELKEQAEEIARHKPGHRMRLVLTDAGPETGETAAAKPPRPNLSVEEFNRILDAAAERNRGLPVLPDEAFERESIYEDRW